MEPKDIFLSREELFHAYCVLVEDFNRLKAQHYVLKELLKAKENK